MWWKLLLLTLYLIILFFLSRLLETFAYYEAGYFSSKLIDPMSLSVRKLQAILDQRGVSYNGVVERKELKELVKSSGVVSSGSLEREALALDEELELSDAELTACTNFTCGSHFYEEVEDTKDSVWVVQVQCDRWQHIMNHSDWKYFIKKVSRFGVRTGHFDCSLDRRLCDRKRWYDTQLILALPVGYQAKDQVVHKSYTGPPRPHNILKWVNRNLASRVAVIDSSDQLKHDWLHFDDRRVSSEKIRVLLFSSLDIPPMFLSVLSVKFTGRAKFGMVDVRTSEGKAMAEQLGLNPDTATYLILTPEQNYTYGYQTGEHLTYESVALLLRTLHPEVNDMFLLSLIIVNLICCLDFFITRGGILKRVGRVLWVIVKWNFLLILLWLPILGLFQLPYMTNVLSHVLSLLRRVSLTSFAVSVRADILCYSTPGGFAALVTTFLIFAVVVGIIHYMFKINDSSTAEESGRSSSWLFEWETYTSTLGRLPARSMNDLDRLMLSNTNMDLELLIERLAVPNLWLSPLVSSQYIHNLPVWKYKGPTIESDVGSDSELNTEAGSVYGVCEGSHRDPATGTVVSASGARCATVSSTVSGILSSTVSSVRCASAASSATGSTIDSSWASAVSASGNVPTFSATGFANATGANWAATAISDAASAIESVATAASLVSQPLLYICEKCRVLQSIATKPEQQLEQRRMESVRAQCAMDGNYRCTCGARGGVTRGTDCRGADGRGGKGGGDRGGVGSEISRGEGSMLQTNPRGRDLRHRCHSNSAQHQANAGVPEPCLSNLTQHQDAPDCLSHTALQANMHLADCLDNSTHHRANAPSALPDSRLSNSTHHHQQGNTPASDCQNPISSEESDGEGSLAPAGMIPVMECSICLESYRRAAVLCGLPCGHSFHQQCIMAWLKRDNHCCPICRWPAYKAKPCNTHQHAE